jgi:hypothetical protein
MADENKNDLLKSVVIGGIGFSIFLSILYAFQFQQPGGGEGGGQPPGEVITISNFSIT